MTEPTEITEFAVTEQVEADGVVLAIAGELDLASASGLDPYLESVCTPGANVRIDFSACTFIDSSGLQTVIKWARGLREIGGQFTVSGLHGEVGEIFQMTGLLVDGSAITEHKEPTSGE